MCDEIPRIETGMHFAIVRHRNEVGRPSNTGRLAHLALPNSSMHCVGRKDEPLDPSALTRGNTWLLFPEGPALAPDAAVQRPDRIVVLDGTWHQARHMRQRLTVLRGIPILRLPAPKMSRERLRTPPSVDSYSTLEAIAAVITRLENAAGGDALFALYDTVVQRSISGQRTELRAWDSSHHAEG